MHGGVDKWIIATTDLLYQVGVGSFFFSHVYDHSEYSETLKGFRL